MRRLRGLARCGGEGEGLLEPPLFILALELNLPKNHVSLKDGFNSNSFDPFSGFFFHKSPKNRKNWKSSEKLLKMGEIFKICNFWAISTCNTSKKRIFHIEFNFKQKKYDLFEKNMKKSNFFDFFFKIDTDQLSSIAIFSNLW